LVPRKTTTRKRLITTAAELFRRQGYAQTGVNQIIQEAKATSGSFYHFFSAKEDLLLAVVEHIAEVFEADVFNPAAERSLDPVDEIFAVLDLYRQQIVDGGFAVVSPMAGLSTEVSENHPQVRARLAELFDSWTTRFETLLQRAADRFSDTADPANLAHLIVGAMEGAVLGTRLSQSLVPFDAAVSELKTYLALLEVRAGVPAAMTGPSRASTRPQPQAADWRSW
jgi:TetR/AcrR family transcriptional repressor of lmrAB and yxaGH operons